MRIWSVRRAALGICVTAMLAGCSASQSLMSATPQSRTTAPSSYQVLYSFAGSPDGGNPQASLIDVKGVLYGTTYHGGKFGLHGRHVGKGTVFSISTSGTEHVLHSFGRGAPRGRYPFASLIDMGGTLYGTTYLGGKNGSGTVFGISATGEEHVLYSFGGGFDGKYPYASLIKVSGTLYGTTLEGGAYRRSVDPYEFGTVFTITPGGTEKILHSFGNGSDGRAPYASLIDVNGTLYGTTIYGGAGSRCGSVGCGTIFSITPGGTEKVLHSFGGSDGSQPYASLIDVNGTLYGTTFYGGAYSAGPYESGTVFSITPSGTEKVLHSFGGNGTDGANPQAGLIDVNGTLYGTTVRGGGGCGTVFSITTGGTEKVLHGFNGADGCTPVASLIDVGGTLYGTTLDGGTNGFGAVFALTP